MTEEQKKLPAKKEYVKPYPTLEDVIGQAKAKEKINEALLSQNNYKLLEFMGIRPPKGILLYGASGTGKTFLARAFANDADSFFIPVSIGSIGSCYINSTANNVLKVQEEAIKMSVAGGYGGKTTLFFDECESLFGNRHAGNSSHKEDDKVANTLCELMDGCHNHPAVIIIGATNRLDLVDKAFLRAGRFDYQVEMDVPNHEERYLMFSRYEQTIRRKNGDSNFASLAYNKLAKETEGWVGSDIAYVMKEAVRRRALSLVTSEEAVPVVKAVETKDILKIIAEHNALKASRDKYVPIGFK